MSTAGWLQMSVNRHRSGRKSEDAPLKISCRKACTAPVAGGCYGELPGECCVACMKRRKTPVKDRDRRRDMRREKKSIDTQP